MFAVRPRLPEGHVFLLLGEVKKEGYLVCRKWDQNTGEGVWEQGTDVGDIYTSDSLICCRKE